MLSLEDFKKLSEIPTASWAIWNDKGPSNESFFRSRISSLHGRVVILGLNRSNGALYRETIPLINFHTPGHRGDSRLRDCIQGENLSAILGAYMTDISDEIESDSNKVIIADPRKAVESLKSQLSFSSEHKRTIICLGNKSFDALCSGIGLKPNRYGKQEDFHHLRSATAKVGNEHWDVYRVWQHSSYGKYEHYGSTQLPNQLRLINGVLLNAQN